MGNRVPLCGNTEADERPSLNEISPKYDLSQDAFKTVQREYLKYPGKFPYVLSHLSEKNQKFIDEYFNCLENEEKVLGDQFYAFHNVLHVTWKRADDIFKVGSLKVTDIVKCENSYRVSILYKMLEWIMQQPKLVRQIFPVEEMAKEGLVLVYLPFYGSVSQPIEIVIDNFLPTFNGNYVVPIPSLSTLGMLLLQKALAKLFGSYQTLRSKSTREIFEVVVGIPVVLQNLSIVEDQVTLLSKFYNPNYKIVTFNQELQAKQSIYVKINATATTNISVGFWQIETTEKLDELAKHGQIIMELIKKDKNGSYSRVGYASKLWVNKTILRSTSPEEESSKNSARQFLTLEEGDYYLYILSQSDKPSVSATIIIYSQLQVNPLLRKESSQLNDIRRAMVSTTFSQRLARAGKPVEEFMECANIRSRFVWDGYRGILCLNSSSKLVRNAVHIEILPEYRRKIKFEQSGEFEMQVEVMNGGRILSFVKLSNVDIGRFYKITSLQNQL